MRRAEALRESVVAAVIDHHGEERDLARASVPRVDGDALLGDDALQLAASRP